MPVSTFQGDQSNFGVAGNAGYGAPPSLVTLRCRYKDLSGVYAVPANPYIIIKSADNNSLVSVDAIGSTQQNGRFSVVQDPVEPSLFSFSFIPLNMKEGLYNVEWGGEFQDVDGKKHTTLIVGQIALGQITRIQDFINRVVSRLFDDHFVDYRLDEPVRQFPDKNIFGYLRDTISRVNSSGPKQTFYDLNTFPMETDELVVTGGVIFALYARARFEKANEMNYSDVHSLNIQRAEFYKSLADTLMKDWLTAIVDWKKSSPPRPIGMKSQRLPFRLFRVIGMLPNYKSYFSG